MSAYVYILRNAAGDAIYVGCSHNLAQRRTTHRKTYWWRQVAGWQVIGPFASRESALRRERDLIAALQPRFNRTGTARNISPVEAEAQAAQYAYNNCFYQRRLVVDEFSFRHAKRRLNRALNALDAELHRHAAPA